MKEDTGKIKFGIESATQSAVIGQGALLAMAVAGGIAVANIYYNQPMLGLIEADFSEQITGMVPTATQLGYALGLFLLLPLGDLVNRRRMIIDQFVVLAAALALAALAPTAWMLVSSSIIVGACSTVAQQIVPFAASLAAPEKRGATIGTVMAGVLSGILFSRTLSGFVGEHAGWREMFWIGVPLALFAAGLMFAVLPHHRPTSTLRYHQAIRSLGQLWKRHPALRAATIIQAFLFASLTAFWTILALYLAGSYSSGHRSRRSVVNVVWIGAATAMLSMKLAPRELACLLWLSNGRLSRRLPYSSGKSTPILRARLKLWGREQFSIRLRDWTFVTERFKSDLVSAKHSKFHKIDYAIFVCSRKVKVSCFCKVGMSHSPGLIDTWEIADGTDYDERARFAADRGFVESHSRSNDDGISGTCTCPE